MIMQNGVYRNIGFVLGVSYGFLAYQDDAYRMSNIVSTVVNFGGGLFSAILIERFGKDDYQDSAVLDGPTIAGSVILGAASYYLDKGCNITDIFLPKVLQNAIDYCVVDHSVFALTSISVAVPMILIGAEQIVQSCIVLP